MPATEGQIGHHRRHFDLADQLAQGVNAMHAIAGAAPDVPILVAAHAVRKARFHLVEDARIRQAGTLCRNVEYAQILQRIHRRGYAGLCDIKPALVRGKTQSVGTLKVVGNDTQFAVARIESIEIGGKLRFAPASFLLVSDPAWRAAEPERAM